MRDFKTFIVDNAPRPQPSVKIAIIDTGVDCNKLDHPIVTGVSFYAGNRHPKGQSWNPLFLEFDANPSIHGTRMAICVQKVCPEAELYIARMDDSNTGSQEFTLRSAIDVGTIKPVLTMTMHSD